MVSGCGNALVLKHLTDFFHFFSGGAIDDTAFSRSGFNEVQQGQRLALGLHNRKPKIGPVIPGDDPEWILQSQNTFHIIPNFLCGGCRKRRNNRSDFQQLEKIRNSQITGSEILTPLGDTVGFIHGYHGNFQIADRRQEAFRQKPFRGDIDDFVFFLLNISQHKPNLFR